MILTPTRTGRLYTPEEEEFMRENYRNMTDNELAEHLGRSAGSVKSHLALMKLRRRVRISDYDCEVRKLARNGVSLNDIADKIGTTYHAVFQYCRSHNIRFKRYFDN